MPTVASTRLTTSAFLASGRKAMRSVRQPSRKPKATASAKVRQIVHAQLHVQHPGDEAGEHEQLALGEVDDARRLVHHHEAERDEGIERPRRHAAHQQVD